MIDGIISGLSGFVGPALAFWLSKFRYRSVFLSATLATYVFILAPGIYEAGLTATIHRAIAGGFSPEFFLTPMAVGMIVVIVAFIGSLNRALVLETRADGTAQLDLPTHVAPRRTLGTPGIVERHPGAPPGGATYAMPVASNYLSLVHGTVTRPSAQDLLVQAVVQYSSARNRHWETPDGVARQVIAPSLHAADKRRIAPAGSVHFYSVYATEKIKQQSSSRLMVPPIFVESLALKMDWAVIAVGSSFVWH